MGEGTATMTAEGERGMDKRDEYRELLVHEVGFTPQQADDCTSGDIDRNGAAAMLSGIIEALETYHLLKPFTDDEIIEHGTDQAGNMIGGFDGRRALLTALKLLARARDAETKLGHAEAEVRTLRLHVARVDPGPESPDNAATRTLIAAGATARAVVEDLLTHGVEIASPSGREALAERLAGVIGGHAHRDVKPAKAIDPRVIAEAIADHLDTNGWESGRPRKPFAERLSSVIEDGDPIGTADTMRAGYENLVSELKSVVSRFAHHDVKPDKPATPASVHLCLNENGRVMAVYEASEDAQERVGQGGAVQVESWRVIREGPPVPTFPQWCAFETDPRSEHAFHGPHDTKDDAIAEALLLRLEDPGLEVAVRRCRRVRVTDALARWAAERLVDHINDDTMVLADADGVTCYGDWENQIASLREDLDARVKLKLWLIEHPKEAHDVA